MKRSPSALLAASIVAASLLAAHGGAAAQALPDTLGKIRTAGQINVAYSPESIPFSADDSNKRPAGYSIDLCKGIIAAIGRQVGNTNLRVNWIPGTVSERLAMVKAGRADLECANTTSTIGRMADVDFSNLVFIDGGGLLVRADSQIKDFPSLAGKRVGVAVGTTTQTRLATMLRNLRIDATIVQVRDGLEGPAMIEAGTLDAFAGDKIKLVGLAVTSRNPAIFAVLESNLSFEPYAFALPRNDSSLRLVVNRELTRIYVSGEIDTIFNQWLGKLGQPSGLLAAMFLLNAVPD